MKRREVTIGLICVATPAVLLAQPTTATKRGPKLASLSDINRWLDLIERDPKARTIEGWPLAQVLEHVAQSIGYSIDGFPQPKPEWFQSTAGSAAFAWFKWRTVMSHGLNEHIPGAPPLVATTQAQGIETLRKAISRFNAHPGTLKPHFAYGNLSKADHAVAHVMHLDNHLDWVRMG